MANPDDPFNLDGMWKVRTRPLGQQFWAPLRGTLSYLIYLPAMEEALSDTAQLLGCALF